MDIDENCGKWGWSVCGFDGESRWKEKAVGSGGGGEDGSEEGRKN